MGIVVERVIAVDMIQRNMLREIAEQLELAAEGDPRFWAGLREELGRVRMARGARRDQAAQTAGPITDVGVQVAPITEKRVAQTGQPTDDFRNSSSSGEPEERCASALTDSPPPAAVGIAGAGTTFTVSVLGPARFHFAIGAVAKAQL
ncbi:rex protein [Lasius niger]|uniref:Rex protein n=1 Tax=Lasius niger TaxID=67767 RepID=A0A0J7KHJ5_LASNI|nr:rex protein [Lasius niger]